MIEPHSLSLSVSPVGDADEAGDDDGGGDGGQDEAEHEAHRPGETHDEVGENGHGSRLHKAERRRESIVGLIWSSEPSLSSTLLLTFCS